MAVLFIFPLAWSILTSLKPAIEASAVPPTGLPTSISWENYAKLNDYGLGVVRYFINSVLVTLGTVLGSLILSTIGGYGFSRFSFPGKNILFVTILAALMIPFQSILTPLFLILHRIGLQNTLLGLILVYITFQLPFAPETAIFPKLFSTKSEPLTRRGFRSSGFAKPDVTDEHVKSYKG